MKKIISLILALLCLTTASAQLVRSTTFKKERHVTQWYGRVGLAFNNAAGKAGEELLNDDQYDGDDVSASINPKLGYDLEIGFNKALGNAGAYWGMHFALGTRGASFKSSGEETYRDETFVNEEKASILLYTFRYSPFTIGYKYNITDGITLDGHLGVYASIDFGHSVKDKWVDEGEKYDEDVDWSDFKHDINYCPFDAGIQAGIGVWLGKINVDLTYQRGFVPVGEYWYDYLDDSAKAYSSNLMLRVGYAF